MSSPTEFDFPIYLLRSLIWVTPAIGLVVLYSAVRRRMPGPAAGFRLWVGYWLAWGPANMFGGIAQYDLFLPAAYRNAYGDAPLVAALAAATVCFCAGGILAAGARVEGVSLIGAVAHVPATATWRSLKGRAFWAVSAVGAALAFLVYVAGHAISLAIG